MKPYITHLTKRFSNRYAYFFCGKRKRIPFMGKLNFKCCNTCFRKESRRARRVQYKKIHA